MATKKELSMAIKLAITSVLAIAGIIYILKTPPVESIEGYQKQKMPTVTHSSRQIEAPAAPTKEANGDVSLTGKDGRYDSSRIGK